MKAKYGIDLDRYEALLAFQEGTCAVCPRPLTTSRRLAIDHDHACCPGEASCGNCIRGLLCPNCNRGLGLFQDSATFMMRGAKYLLLNAAVVKVLLEK
ncbi:endonuclease VII domain-containing protein [Arthrobacter sp. ISL-69]|nr:endonuclease VII domain-containing protein [Arthrobacter sp. ISL-69]